MGAQSKDACGAGFRRESSIARLEKKMKSLVRLSGVFLPVLFLVPLSHGQFAGSVDPLLGVAGGGNVFPGPVVPFGMIKPGPDMVAPEGHDANAGWNANGDICGFSQTHVSGTGGGAKYGNILVQATTGEIAAAYRRRVPRPQGGVKLTLDTRGRTPSPRRG